MSNSNLSGQSVSPSMSSSSLSQVSKSETILILGHSPEGSLPSWANDIQLRGFNQIAYQSFAHWEKLGTFDFVPQVLLLDVNQVEGVPERLMAWVKDVPTLVLLNELNEDALIYWHDFGAVDVLARPAGQVEQTYLMTRILNALERGSLLNRLEQREKLLASSGVYDADVRLFNAPYWEQLVYDALRQLPQSDQHQEDVSRQVFSLVSVQLVSALTGEPVRFGESGCYKALADEVVSVCRGTDIVGRFGQDYLGVLLPATRQHQAEILCQRLDNALTRVLPSAPKMGLMFKAIEVTSSQATVPELLQSIMGL